MPGERAWRKLLKKEQRKRRRQKYARENEKQQEGDPEYQQWLKQQMELEEFQRLADERLQQDEEIAWLRREALAQRQFHLDSAQLRQQEMEAERLRARQSEELAALQHEQHRRREERERLATEAAAEFEAMMQRMQEYMDNAEQHTPPSELRRVVETHPEERLCEFFTRTNCCRFGQACTFNHRRPMLSKIILIRHFFIHPLLQVADTKTEYAKSDEHLELTDHDLRVDYDEFFKDVVGELEKFGKIVNFRAVRNTLPHLRGNVFVEYAQERFALRAFVNLQSRYYASRRLNVEFSNLNAWRGAICGLSLTRKCPKGYSCGYLHLFRNPNNVFNVNLETHITPSSVRSHSNTPRSRAPSWNDDEKESRNWRWSESPELELTNSKSKMNRSHRSSERRSRSREDDKNNGQKSYSSRDYQARSNNRSSSHKSKSHKLDRSPSRSPGRHRHASRRHKYNRKINQGTV
ncbi:U2 small nuclear ribonucleoprotein auxiliary factor 35 kDa subunit-related protein 2 isoform X1 [Drosophila sulfurigaster albostrigata]|uniref:U2 small nuclear ribonucleoprotein auxiliary factor 35 kDa subunit-related protein 2 isoform X1 n=1 Tax=Drosophila sulfurigaster albostrigata TaxID=89887 RepID=UPI002D21EC83|nr:U2 small nuclear ribonucleoprotein auxiliary factor 35 kDa subunit-related protein 2 isoform X1 [Drosophila sulfurigaster albostrigata]